MMSERFILCPFPARNAMMKAEVGIYRLMPGDEHLMASPYPSRRDGGAGRAILINN